MKQATAKYRESSTRRCAPSLRMMAGKGDGEMKYKEPCAIKGMTTWQDGVRCSDVSFFWVFYGYY